MNRTKYLRLVFVVSLGTLLLQGCADSNLSEVRAFMDEERSKRGPRIDPLPSFPPYVSAVYTSAGLKSPFDPPNAINDANLKGNTVAAPNPGRVKEYLERFNVAELKMVGTIEQNGVHWALINDGTGSVHRVTAGNYLGRNHGLIDAVNATGLELVEVVVDGRGGWIERPRSISMATE